LEKSNLVAGVLALLLGPVGLWYKGHWVAGFAWMIISLVLWAAVDFFAIPIVVIGLVIHAVAAKPKSGGRIGAPQGQAPASLAKPQAAHGKTDRNEIIVLCAIAAILVVGVLALVASSAGL
jgi:hypothetical protein